MEVRQIPRIILRGDIERASYRAREGMRQLNILKELMGFQKLKQDVRRVQYIDKSEIICKSIFGEDIVEIYVPKKEAGRTFKRPIVLVAVGYYSHPGIPNSESINPFIDYYTYPRKVMLYDVIDDCVIETTMDDVTHQSITTTQLKDIYGINVWHYDAYGNYTDIGFRLSDDVYHEKSFPLSRYLFNTDGFMGDGYVYAHGAHKYPAVTWGASSTPAPLPPTAPTVPSSMTGSCLWNTPRYENSNRNEVIVDTKGTGVEATNSHTRYIFFEQYDLICQNARPCPGCPGCPPETTIFKLIIETPAQGRVDWRTKYGNSVDKRIFKNYGRFGGSYRLTTRDKYPSLETGCTGYVQTKYDDYQDQASHLQGGAMWGGFGYQPCPTELYSYERTINIIVECSFGEIYRTVFSHGTYNYWTCVRIGTEGSDGDPFQFPGAQQAHISLEAGIIDSKVVSVSLAVAGTEHLAWPYIGDYAHPGRWDNSNAYKELRVNGVKAGINVTELDTDLDYIDMIMSANDIDYFSLETGQLIQWGDEEIDELEEGEVGNFEIAVNALVEEYYGEDKKLVDPRICLESRVIEQYIEKNIETGVERIIGYGSCTQPNPWLTPKIDQPFWRPL